MPHPSSSYQLMHAAPNYSWLWDILLAAMPVTDVAIAQQNCSPAYPDVCITPPPPDLDCPDIPYRNFQVRSPNPHHFDGDRDGIGCEQN